MAICFAAMLFPLLLATAPLQVKAACSSTAPQGGTCGNGVCCPTGQCCSQYGWCGITTAHCGTGCQTAWGQCTGTGTPSPASQTLSITVGPGTSSTKTVTLPYSGMTCPSPCGIGCRLNTDYSTAPDSFQLVVIGQQLQVTRLDSPTSWGMNLIVPCTTGNVAARSRLPSSSRSPVKVPAASPRSKSRSPATVVRSPSPKGSSTCVSGPACDGSKKFSTEVLNILGGVTKIYDGEVWANIMGIIAKPEQDMGPATWDQSSSGGTVFAYAEALTYDYEQRGVTAGLVGFTSANDGNEEWGDLQYMLGLYAARGGSDLTRLCSGTTTDYQKCIDLIAALKGVGSDPRYIAAQWEAITKSTYEGAYLYHAVRILKTRIPNPRPLTIAACFDHALNTGISGSTYDLDWVIGQIDPAITNEAVFLDAMTDIRSGILGENGYNSSPLNGQNRALIIRKIQNAGCWTLKGCDAAVAAALNYVLE